VDTSNTKTLLAKHGNATSERREYGANVKPLLGFYACTCFDGRKALVSPHNENRGIARMLSTG
jgi:hypothetical protein